MPKRDEIAVAGHHLPGARRYEYNYLGVLQSRMAKYSLPNINGVRLSRSDIKRTTI
jgi:hypothetical protein